MKECVFGWYPPARDILKTYQGKQPMDSYKKECLYQHPNSRYADKPGVGTPEDPLDTGKWRASPQQIRKYKSWSRAASRASHTPDRAKSATISLEIRGFNQGQETNRPKSCASIVDNRKEVTPARSYSAFGARATPDEKLFATTSDIKMFSPTPPNGNYMRKSCSSQNSNRPGKAWSLKTEETKPIAAPDFETFYKEMTEEQRQRLSPHPPTPTQHTTEYDHQYRTSNLTPESHDVSCSSAERRDRIKSATTYRPRLSAQRPVKSAGPVRCSHVNDDRYDPEARDPAEVRRERMWQLDRMVDELTTDEDNTELIETADGAPMPTTVLPDTDEELGVDQPKDYDEMLEKHGWRMQVHGDPLNLKKQCIAKRQSFTVKVPIPVIAPDPPKARSECFDTFFLNTIPRKPMSFTIHQDWASEVLHAKRMQLQKRDGEPYKYRTSHFSFVY